MKSVIYISTRAKNFSDENLHTLVTSCRTRNANDDITGCLVYNGMNFMQLIEGDNDTIDACMARIVKDERHSGVVTVREREIDQRECPDWGMVGLSVSRNPTEAEKKQILDMLDGGQTDTRNLFTSFATL